MSGSVRVVAYRSASHAGRWIRNVGDLTTGVIVADLLDHTAATIFDVADAVLDGMGKDNFAYVLKRRCEPLAAAWLRVGPTKTVVIPDAQLIDPDALIAGVNWLRGHNADVWAACATRSPQLPDRTTYELCQRLVRDADAHETDEADLRDTFSSRQPWPPQPEPWPRVPRVDGIVFRDWCRRLLTQESFAIVDDEFVASTKRIYSALPDALTPPVRTRKLWPILRTEIDSAISVDHLVIRVRAAQVACLLRGWHLHVDTNMLLGAAHVLPRAGQLEAQRCWELLDSYRDPDVGAVASLYLAGVDAETIRGLRVGDIDASEDADVPLVITTPAGAIEVANEGRRYVRVLATYRRLCGASDNDPLFESHRGPGLSRKHLRRLVDAPAAEVGVSVTAGRVQPASPLPEQQVRRYGLDLALLVNDRGRRTATT